MRRDHTTVYGGPSRIHVRARRQCESPIPNIETVRDTVRSQSRSAVTAVLAWCDRRQDRDRVTVSLSRGVSHRQLACQHRTNPSARRADEVTFRGADVSDLVQEIRCRALDLPDDVSPGKVYGLIRTVARDMVRAASICPRTRAAGRLAREAGTRADNRARQYLARVTATVESLADQFGQFGQVTGNLAELDRLSAVSRTGYTITPNTVARVAAAVSAIQSGEPIPGGHGLRRAEGALVVALTETIG